MIVKLVNRAEAAVQLVSTECQAATKGGDGRCRNCARWRFVLDDQREVYVCRMHANQGERAGELAVADELVEGPTPLVDREEVEAVAFYVDGSGSVEGRELMTEQPPPIPNNNPCSWERVLADTEKLWEEIVSAIEDVDEKTEADLVFDSLVTDMERRNVQGTEKYGTPLQPHNGRDSLRDAYEEALDASVYLANYDAEVGHHNHHGLSKKAIRLAFSIRCRLYARDGR